MTLEPSIRQSFCHCAWKQALGLEAKRKKQKKIITKLDFLIIKHFRARGTSSPEKNGNPQMGVNNRSHISDRGQMSGLYKRNVYHPTESKQRNCGKRMQTAFMMMDKCPATKWKKSITEAPTETRMSFLPCQGWPFKTKQTKEHTLPPDRTASVCGTTRPLGSMQSLWESLGLLLKPFRIELLLGNFTARWEAPK